MFQLIIRWRSEDAFICFLQSAEKSADFTFDLKPIQTMQEKNYMKEVQFSLGE